MGIAALVLGIISIVWAVFGGTWLAAVVGLIGIILGAVGKKQNANLATAGLVLSIIGTSLGLLMYIACIACIGGMAGILGSV